LPRSLGAIEELSALHIGRKEKVQKQAVPLKTIEIVFEALSSFNLMPSRIVILPNKKKQEAQSEKRNIQQMMQHVSKSINYR